MSQSTSMLVYWKERKDFAQSYGPGIRTFDVPGIIMDLYCSMVVKGFAHSI